MTGFSEIRFFPLDVSNMISSFKYMVICIVVYRIKREKLMVEKRVENLPHREQQQNIKKDVKKRRAETERYNPIKEHGSWNCWGKSLLLRVLC